MCASWVLPSVASLTEQSVCSKCSYVTGPHGQLNEVSFLLLGKLSNVALSLIWSFDGENYGLTWTTLGEDSTQIKLNRLNKLCRKKV